MNDMERQVEIDALVEIVAPVRGAANRLFSEPALRCSCRKFGAAAPTCLQREEERKLNREEKANGWSRRPFNAYREENLCASCLAYWHAERAAQVLEDMLKFARYAQARGE